SRVYLEGNILKLFNPNGDPELETYLTTAVQKDKSMRQKRLDITKQIQIQNRELSRFNDQVTLLNKDLTLALEEQKKAKEQLLVTLAKLEKQNRDLAQFSWMISHNLRGPLASTLGIVNLLKNFYQDSKDYRDLYDHLRASALRMDEIMADVSMLLEVRDSPPILNEDLDMKSVFDEACRQVGALWEEYSGGVKVDFTGCPRVLATRIYLQSILMHLISNALQYRSPDRSLEVKLTSGIDDGFLVLTVSDNGSGIAVNDHEKIFEPFRKLDYASKGKGLGLYLSRTLAEAMGGTLTVASDLGAGAVFTLRLPLNGTD
ncbi:MAG: sensor histidine kinase, partial [Bacteroidota bacterium]